jgi:hypothetical protein
MKVLGTTAAIAIVPDIQPAIAIVFQVTLLSPTNHRKLMYPKNARFSRTLKSSR